MLDIKSIRKDLIRIQTAVANRGDVVDWDELITLDDRRKIDLLEIENLRHQRNVVSEEIAAMKKAGHPADTPVAEMRAVANQIKTLDMRLAETAAMIQTILMRIPNPPHASVPVGGDEQDNVEIKTAGTPPAFDFAPAAHWDLGENLGLLDFKRAARITGARFPLYIGAGARLERALISLMLDRHTKLHGYTEILPPFIVNRKSMTHTGQLPKFEEDLFKLEGWDYFLIPTAEVPVTNMHHGEILSEDVLPLYYTAYTPC
ncbi:MAG: serine--tRNA ligase, partial [Desulfobacterales bacterium]